MQTENLQNRGNRQHVKIWKSVALDLAAGPRSLGTELAEGHDDTPTGLGLGFRAKQALMASAGGKGESRSNEGEGSTCASTFAA